MLVYFLLLFLALSNLAFVKNPKMVNMLSYITIAYMFILCGFRAETIGTDTGNYVNIINGTKANAEEKMEFQLVLRFLVEIARATSIPVFCSLCAALTYLPLFVVLNRVCKKYLPIALLLLIVSMQAYFICSMNILRQMMASVFLLYSFYEINKGNLLKFIILYIMALLTHTMSLLYLPFIILSFYRLSFKTVTVIVVVANFYAFFLVSEGVLENLLSQFKNIEYLNLYHFAYYANETEHYGVFGMMKQLLPTSLLCLYSYRILDGHFYCRLYLWGTVLLCLAAPLSIYALRISQGLYILELFIIPMLYYVLPKRKLWIINGYIVFLIFYFVYTMFNLYIDDKYIVPYKFFFE